MTEGIEDKRRALDALLAGAAAVAGTAVEVVDDLTFSSRAVVARVRPGGGDTAIAKMPFEAESLTSEVEAMRLLPPQVRPACFGSADGVVLMEDLGTGPSLADVLLGDHPAAAERALSAWAAALGSAVGATMRHGAPPRPVTLGAGLEAFKGLAGDLDVAVPAGVAEDVRRVEQDLSAPSPWLAYCPGDTCPDNNRVLADGTVRFFDFEGSGWRHAATEAAYCRTPFCTCWCVAGLPDGMTAAMENAFVDAAQPPEAGEFRAAVGLAAISWTLMTSDFLRRFVSAGRPVGPPGIAPIDGRQYAVVRLRAMEAERAQTPALAALARDLREAIVERWPHAAAPPVYPASRSGGRP